MQLHGLRPQPQCWRREIKLCCAAAGIHHAVPDGSICTGKGQAAYMPVGEVKDIIAWNARRQTELEKTGCHQQMAHPAKPARQNAVGLGQLHRRSALRAGVFNDPGIIQAFPRTGCRMSIRPGFRPRIFRRNGISVSALPAPVRTSNRNAPRAAGFYRSWNTD